MIIKLLMSHVGNQNLDDCGKRFGLKGKSCVIISLVNCMSSDIE